MSGGNGSVRARGPRGGTHCPGPGMLGSAPICFWTMPARAFKHSPNAASDLASSAEGLKVIAMVGLACAWGEGLG